jgi:thioredoxin reductase (NADPH)
MYAARARLKVRILEKGAPGGQVNETAMVENYPGFESIGGAELASKMESQARSFGAALTADRVERVAHEDGLFALECESGSVYKAPALIIALGASPVKLGIPGETELTGRGVSYCAVCDGPFYRDKDVAVIGGGDSAVEEAVYLTRFASSVHIVHRRDEFRAVKEIQERAFAQPKIHVHWSAVPTAVLGSDGVEALRIRSLKDGTEHDIPVYGVFFYVGLRPVTPDGIVDLVQTDDRGFIMTDSTMACATPGLFAAGDVRVKPLRQISTAVGDGALAAFMAQAYLEQLERQ